MSIRLTPHRLDSHHTWRLRTHLAPTGEFNQGVKTRVSDLEQNYN